MKQQHEESSCVDFSLMAFVR